MSLTQDDELMLLWRQGTSAEPDPREIARLAGRASMRKFDRFIFWRNRVEYVAGLLGFVFLGWLTQDEPLNALVGFLCVGFSLGYLWWQHHDIKPLNPSADARAYHAAMLARFDRQIRLLGSAHFWGLPVYLFLVWMLFRHPEPVLTSMRDLAALVAFYLVVAWVNAHWGVRWLRAERSKIERLYEE
jgi:hypothetical protein